MEVNQDTITHLAKLSDIALTSEESQSLENDLQNIIQYISQLDQLDTDKIKPTYQVFEMENIWRPDEIQPQEANREQLLSLTPTVENYQIKVPKVL